MTTENTNSGAAAPESALSHSALTLEQAMDIDFADPLEDNGTVETDGQSEAQPDEGEEAQEAENPDDASAEDDESDEGDGQAEDGEGDDDAPEAEAAAIPDDAVIELPSGEKLPLNELKAGYMRQADYTRKRQVEAQQAQEVQALASNLEKSFSAIVDHLAKTIPPEPDQRLLFSNDPKQVTEYHRLKLIHENAMKGLEQVIAQAQAPKDAANKLTEQQHQELIRSEGAKLAEAFPQIRTPEGQKKFFEEATQVAKELGYSDEEIGQAVDHRLFKLAHYARLGLQAEAAKAKAAQKVVNVPPVAPAKRQAGKGNAQTADRNRKAMARLSKTGSIYDALEVDFD